MNERDVTEDVEGHKVRGIPTEEPEDVAGHKVHAAPESSEADDVQGHLFSGPTRPAAPDEDDVEGHTRTR